MAKSFECDWRRRHAIQIAAQLPEDAGDALQVLEYAKELVENFLSPVDQPPRPEPRLVVLSGSVAVPSRLASDVLRPAALSK